MVRERPWWGRACLGRPGQMAVSVVPESDRTVAVELTGLGWTLAQRFYDRWCLRNGGAPWAELHSDMRESLAQVFERLLNEAIIEVGPALSHRPASWASL